MKEGWTYKTLGDLCTIKGRIGFRGYTREDLVDEGKGAITLSPANIIDDVLDFSKCSFISWFKYNESPEIMIAEGDIIYAKTASIGKVALVEHLPEKATINPQFVVFKNISCNRKYLYYTLRSRFFKSQAESITRGVAIPTISQANLAQANIPIPSEDEQERIVAELDLLTEIIDKQKAQLKELDTLAQSIFYDMFGDPVENEKGWEVKKLGKMCDLKAGKAIKASELSENNEYPCFGGNGIRGYINKCSHNESYPIIGRQGAYCGTVNFADAPFYATEHAVVVKPLTDLNVKWLYYTLINLNLSRFAKGQAQPGIAVGNLNENVFIPLPPLSLQQSFAEKINTIEQQKAAITQSIAETQKLFDYTMDKYFG